MSRLAVAYGGLPDSPVWPSNGSGTILTIAQQARMSTRGLLTGRTAYGGSYSAAYAAGDTGVAYARYGVRQQRTGLARFSRLAYVPSVFATDGLDSGVVPLTTLTQDILDAIALRDADIAEAGVELVVRLPDIVTAQVETTNPYLAGIPFECGEVETVLPISFTPSTGGFYAGTPFTAAPELVARGGVGGGRFALILATVQAGPIYRLDDNSLPQTSGLFNIPHDGCAGYFAFRYSFADIADPPGTAAPFAGAVDISQFSGPAQGFSVNEFLVALPAAAAADADILAAYASKFDRYSIHWVSAPTNRREVFYTGTSTGSDRVEHSPVSAAAVYGPVAPTSAGVDYSYEFADPQNPTAFANAIVDAAIAALT